MQQETLSSPQVFKINEAFAIGNLDMWKFLRGYAGQANEHPSYLTGSESASVCHAVCGFPRAHVKPPTAFGKIPGNQKTRAKPRPFSGEASSGLVRATGQDQRNFTCHFSSAPAWSSPGAPRGE
jgi:hypothetical protein